VVSCIKFYRKKAGLTQGQLAKSMGVSLDTISRYETNKREPRVSDLCRMADILGCTPIELMMESEANPPIPRKVAKMRESGMTGRRML
jgi:transcriptional regulator with XRE-family HTH domain